MEQPGPNLLPNGMAPQNLNTMQRPQPGNLQQQIHATVLETLRQKQGQLPPGWQSTFDLRDRASGIMQIITLLRFLNQDVRHCINVASSFEERTILESPNKETYKQKIQAKLGDITQHRATNVQHGLQQGQMGMPVNNNGGNMGIPPNGMGNMNFMQNMGMGATNGAGMNMSMNNGFDLQNMSMNMGMGNGQLGGNGMQLNQNFPAHLQRQMQPSPLPPHNQLQPPPNNTLDPAALRNPQMPAQMQGMNQQPNLGQGGGPIQPSIDEVSARARQMLAAMTEENKASLRARIWTSMPESARQQMAANGQDLVVKWVHKTVRDGLVREKNSLQQPGQQNAGGMMMGNNMNVGGNNMQQQPSTQGDSQNIDFNTITGLQANAIKSQESGGEVVPASNNPSGFNPGGSVNIPQGVNPHVLGNQNGQQGNNLSMQQMQMLAMQQQRQREMQAQAQKNRVAQQQAMAQAQQAQANLRGQPGGLTTPNALNGGQGNSPAMNMSMLTRPMAPPGKGTPSTPHQNQQPPGMPQTPMNPAGQLAQHHQNMLHQNQSNPQFNNMPNNLREFINRLPNPDMRARLSGLQPQQAYEVLKGMAAKSGTNLQQLLANMSNVNAHAAPPMNLQQPVNNGFQQNMGNAVPNFTSQPPPSQQPQRPVPDPGAMQRMQQQQHAQFRQRALDLQQYPKPLLQRLGIQVPEQVDTWFKLKQHILQNQGILPPNTIQRVGQAQAQWFDSHPEDVQRALAEFQRQIAAQRAQQQQQQLQQQQQQQQQQGQQGKPQPQQPPGVRPPSSASVVGQAPQAQMVPPTAPMQQQGAAQGMNMSGANMGQGQGRIPQVPMTSDTEVAHFRVRFPNATNKSDDDIRKLIREGKLARLRQNNGMMPGGGMGQQPGQQAGPRPQQGQTQQGNAAAQAQAQNRQQTGGDDVVEIKNPATTGPGNAGAAAMQHNVPQAMGQSFGGMKMPTQEQLKAMPPQQRQRFEMEMQQREALRKAQSGLASGQAGNVNQQQSMQNQASAAQQPQPGQAPQQAADPNQALMQQRMREDHAKLEQWYKEIERSTPRGQPLQMNSVQFAEAQPLLKKLFPLIGSMSRTYMSALRHPALGESKVKEAMKIHVLLRHNIADATGRVKDFLAVPVQELKNMEKAMAAYLRVLGGQTRAAANAAQANANQMQQQQQQQQQQIQGQVQAPTTAQQVPPPQQPATATAPPLDRKPSASGAHVRKQSSSNKVPAAPTENKTFDWGAPSPHGVPKYDPARTELTPDKLKFPPSKKRKTGQQSESQSSTPAAQSGTPGATGATMGTSPAAIAAKGAPSPEQIRKMQQVGKSQEVARPKFKCEDMTCEKSITGFETEEQLVKHRDVEHQPIQDVLGFLLDGTEAFLNAEESTPAAPRETPATTRGLKATPSLSKGVVVKNEKPSSSAATPSAVTKTLSGKLPATPASISKKDAEPTDLPTAPEPSLLDLMAQKVGFELTVPRAPSPHKPASWTPSLDEWNDLLFSNFTHNPTTTTGTHHTDAFLADDFSHFAGVTDWGLPPPPPALEDASDSATSPHLTPDSRSSRESDISRGAALRINLREWDPFGSEGGGEKGDGLSTAGTFGAGEVVNERKDGAEGEMDWSGDLFEFDDLFGGAGVGGPGEEDAGMR